MKTFLILAITGIVIVSLFTWVARALDCLISKVDKTYDREDLPEMWDGDE